jgi:putative membrane protein
MKSNRMHIVVLCGTIIVLTGVGVAQMDSGMSPQQQPGTSPDMQDSVPSGLTGPQMRDRAFIRQAITGGLAEIQMGQLALQKSSNDNVKKFAQMMIDDHTTMNNQLHPVADSMGMMMVKGLDKADQVEYDKLKALSGSDFDKAYITDMVKGHRAVQHAFRLELVVVTDPGLKEQVTNAVPVIRRHLEAVRGVAGELNIPLPARTSPAK